ncbi:hypothetical protein OHT76_40340 [Streptomyces sp. NBC_00287]|uniref:hypothetical protein n=1 Tax=Streptomyces sp. NBC_00287 TaxID=2975702 RepID=UPI002E28A921|nr:hypothetical protein [Streptomyces sp. NBC_00287]
MAFHNRLLTASEGCRVMVNGSGGRLELEVEESRWQPRRIRVTAAEHAGGARLTLRPLWQPPRDIPLVTAHEAHGGGDPRMLDALFGPVEPGQPTSRVRAATERDGALALTVGLAANRCFETGRPVAVDEVVRLP